MGKVNLELVCCLCHKKHYMEVSLEDLEKYQNGALVQEAFHTLTPTEREKIISGMCDECQKEFFTEEDEEE